MKGPTFTERQATLTRERSALLEDLDELRFLLISSRRRTDPHSCYLYLELKAFLEKLKNPDGGFEATIDFWRLPASERRRLQSGPPTKL